MVDPVHGGHDGEKDLGRADVRGGLLTADVLLAGLQGETVGGLAHCILRHADQAAGQLSFEPRPDDHVTGVRATEAERHTEALAGSYGDVGSQFTGRGQECQRQQVGGHDGDRTRGLRRCDHVGRVPDTARRAGVLHEDAERVGQLGRRSVHAPKVEHGEVYAHGIRPVLQQREGLRERVGVDDETLRRGLGCAAGEQHPLDYGGALVEHGRVRGVEPGQVGDHRLEVDEGLEATLRDLRLIRGVRRIPTRVLEHVPLDDRRGDRAVVAEPDQGPVHGIAVRDGAEFTERRTFACGRREDRRPGLVQLDRCRHGSLHELLDIVVAEEVEHGGLRVIIRADVTRGEEFCHWGGKPHSPTMAEYSW